ncbi:hypothetical protein PPERSA_06488 [Pseudocohnilembus persalinus]|uniref:Uncharacterized protein n=1 Tax=Pseudocohnilembus persalinus TaxID=266149 RepID=A0A0V0QRG8_PSEPJ|nr:hypothetical protein PPERSA_06488 [Pseudocohnilembus persalinus]|eukprot:KRX04854.1 hypothetical protein PPERSA_06488 [Pseudocohnilembus persalinus]
MSQQQNLQSPQYQVQTANQKSFLQSTSLHNSSRLRSHSYQSEFKPRSNSVYQVNQQQFSDQKPSRVQYGTQNQENFINQKLKENPVQTTSIFGPQSFPYSPVQPQIRNSINKQNQYLSTQPVQLVGSPVQRKQVIMNQGSGISTVNQGYLSPSRRVRTSVRSMAASPNMVQKSFQINMNTSISGQASPSKIRAAQQINENNMKNSQHQQRMSEINKYVDSVHKEHLINEERQINGLILDKQQLEDDLQHKNKNISQLQSKIQQLQIDISDKQMLKQNIQHIQQEYFSKVQQLFQQNNRLAQESQKQLAEAKKQYNEEKEQISRHLEEINSKKLQNSIDQGQLEKLELQKKYEQELEFLTQKLQDQQLQCESYQNKSNMQERTIAQLNQDIVSVSLDSQQIQQIQLQNESLTQQINKAFNQIATVETENQNLNYELQKLENENSRKEKNIEELNQKLKASQSENTKQQSTIDNLNYRIRELNSQLNLLQNIEPDLQKLEFQLYQNQQTLSNKIQENEKLQDKLTNCTVDQKVLQQELESQKIIYTNLERASQEKYEQLLQQNQQKLQQEVQNNINSIKKELQLETNQLRKNNENLRDRLQQRDTENSDLIRQNQSQNSTIQKQLKIIEELRYSTIREQESQKDIEIMQKNIQQHKEIQDSQNKEIAYLNQQIKKYINQIEILEKDYESSQITKKLLEQQNQSLQDEIQNLQRQLNESTSQAINNSQKEKEIYQLKNEIKQQNNFNDDLNNEIKNLQIIKYDYEDLNIQYTCLKEEHDKVKKQLIEKEKQAQLLEKDKEDYIKMVEKNSNKSIQHEIKIEDIQRELRQKYRENEDLKDHLKQIQRDYDSLKINSQKQESTRIKELEIKLMNYISENERMVKLLKNR